MAVAQAERDFTVTGDQAAYNNAIAAANSQRASDLQTAAHHYALAEVGAIDLRDGSLLSARTTHDISTGNAKITHAQNLSAAIRDAEIADASAYRDMLLNISDDQQSYLELESSAHAGELTSLAIANNTPWSGLARDKANASHQLLVDYHAASQVQFQNVSNARLTHASDVANANHSLTNQQILAEVNLRNDLNAAEEDFQNAETTNHQNALALGMNPVDDVKPPATPNANSIEVDPPIVQMERFTETTGNATEATEPMLQDTVAGAILSDNDHFVTNPEQDRQAKPVLLGNRLAPATNNTGYLDWLNPDTWVGKIKSFQDALAEAYNDPLNQKIWATRNQLLEDGFPEELVDTFIQNYLAKTETYENALEGVDAAAIQWSEQIKANQPKFVGMASILIAEDDFWKSKTYYNISNDPEHARSQNHPANLVVVGFDLTDSPKLNRLLELLEKGSKVQAEIDATQANIDKNTLPWWEKPFEGMGGIDTHSLRRYWEAENGRAKMKFRRLKLAYDAEFGPLEIIGWNTGTNSENRRTSAGGKGFEAAISAYEASFQQTHPGGLIEGPTYADVWAATGLARLGASAMKVGLRVAVTQLPRMGGALGKASSPTALANGISSAVRSAENGFWKLAQGVSRPNGGGLSLQISGGGAVPVGAVAQGGLKIALTGKLVASAQALGNVVTTNGIYLIKPTAQAGLLFSTINGRTTSTLADRIAITPAGQFGDASQALRGSWTGQRGRSTFTPANTPENAEVIEILNQHGLKGVSYRSGKPNFTPFAVGKVTTTRITTSRYGVNGNFAKADELLAKQWGWTAKEVELYRKANGLTWHEMNDVKTMLLVPSKINSFFGHLGGVSEAARLGL